MPPERLASVTPTTVKSSLPSLRVWPSAASGPCGHSWSADWRSSTITRAPTLASPSETSLPAEALTPVAWKYSGSTPWMLRLAVATPFVASPLAYVVPVMKSYWSERPSSKASTSSDVRSRPT